MEDYRENGGLSYLISNDGISADESFHKVCAFGAATGRVFTDEGPPVFAIFVYKIGRIGASTGHHFAIPILKNYATPKPNLRTHAIRDRYLGEKT